MGGLFNSGSSVQSNVPVISGMQIQTSCFGRPIPWVFGRQRVAPNLIHYDDFKSTAHSQNQSGGKGGGGATSTSYTYSAALILGLCTGSIDSIGKVWRDKDLKTLGDLNLDFYAGTSTQTAYPYFVAKHPDKALAYRGIAYVASGSYDLGNNASLGNHSFELQAVGSIAAQFSGSTVPDADISDVITSILTDAEQGIGFDSAHIGALDQFKAYCLANHLWVSPAYTDQKSAFECIKNLLTIGFADCVYSGGMFKVVPYSDIPATNTYATFVPSIVTLELTEDDFLIGDDIIKISQKSSDESYNRVQIKFKDRANDYNENIAVASDDADIDLHGLRDKDVVELSEIADAAVAQKVADFILARSLYVINTYEFRLPWKYVQVEPMDVLLLTYGPKYLDKTPVLVVDVSGDDDYLTIIAEDFPTGTNRASSKPVQSTDATKINSAVLPSDSHAPVMFEAPARLTNNTPQIWLATSGGAHWGGAVVWASTDGSSYQRIGSVRGGAQHGVLSSPLSADAVNGLQVDLTASNGTLSQGTLQSASDLLTACYVGGEYVAYANEVLTGSHTYNLNQLVRGGYGVNASAHAAGVPFVFLDGSIFKYNYPREWQGKTIWIKLCSFNEFGNSVQDLSAVVAYQHTITGAPVSQASALYAVSRVFGIDLAWSLPFDSADYLQSSEIWYGPTPNISYASKLVMLASPQSSYSITGLKAGDKFYFWVRLIDKQGNTGSFYPSGAGVYGSASTDAKNILDYLSGKISKTQLATELRTPIDSIDQLKLKVVDIEKAMVEIPTGAELQAIVAEQRIGKNEAIAAMQLIAASNADRSLSVAKTDLTAKYQDSVAQVSELKQTVVDNKQSLAQQITTVQAQFNGNIASIQSAQTTIANAQYAQATRIDTVQASVAQNAALIQSEQTARANADSALSSRVDTVTATANGASASVQNVASAVANINGDLSAMQTIKTQIVSGGRTIIAGIGVGVNSRNGVTESQVLLSAQRVAIIDESTGTLQTPFVVQGGQVFINQAVIGEEWITTAHIKTANVDTLRIKGNAVTIPVGAFAAASSVSVGIYLDDNYPVFIQASLTQAYASTIVLVRSGTALWYETPAAGTLASRGIIDYPGPGYWTYMIQSSNPANTNGASIFAQVIKR